MYSQPVYFENEDYVLVILQSGYVCVCVCVCVCVWMLVTHHVWLFVTPLTIVHQAPLSMELSRQEYWCG